MIQNNISNLISSYSWPKYSRYAFQFNTWRLAPKYYIALGAVPIGIIFVLIPFLYQVVVFRFSKAWGKNALVCKIAKNVFVSTKDLRIFMTMFLTETNVKYWLAPFRPFTNSRSSFRNNGIVGRLYWELLLGCGKISNFSKALYSKIWQYLELRFCLGAELFLE